MKVLHIGKFYSPIEGGIESINQVVVEALQGHQQRILSFSRDHFSSEEDVDSVPVVRAASHGIVASQPLSWKYFRELRRSIKIFQPDIIHFHYPNPLAGLYLMLSIRKKNKLIVHWHSDVVAQRLVKPFIRPLENWLLKRSNGIIATSPTYIAASSNLSKFKSKVKVIPCSINEDNFKRREGDNLKIEEIKDLYNNNPIVFFVGRHVEYKGISYLLEAEKLIKSNCEIVVGGSGPLTEELKNKYNSPRIHWVGRLSDDEMRQYMYASSVYAFPSITRNEAFGVALAEAMYCSLPAVTFTIDGSGVNWVSLNGVTGLEVENRNVGALAMAVDTLLSDKNLHKKMRVEAHSRVEKNFIKESVIPLYREFYQEIMNK